ncbi:hypothetical protein AMTRI_Chr11g150090 [Amborella trichopoda]
MEDSSNAPRNKRQRLADLQSSGNESSPDTRTPRRSASSTDSINMLTTSVALMEKLEPIMTPAAGSRETLETTPGSLSGLEESTSLVHGSLSASEEVHEARQVSKERENPITASFSSSLEPSQPVEDTCFSEEETQAPIVNSGAMSSSHMDQEREHVPKEITPLNSNEMEASLSEHIEALSTGQEWPGSMENPDLTNQEGQHSQEKPEDAEAGGGEVEERPEVAEVGGGREVEEGEVVGAESHPRATTNDSAIEYIVKINDERDLVELTRFGENELGRAHRRLVNFSIRNAAAHRVFFDDRSSGNLFISGVVLPFNGAELNFRFYCVCFGPVRSWCITGFREGSLEIWVSTDIADYLCVNAATEYQTLYNFFHYKALLCIQATHELEEDPELEMDRLSNCLATLSHECLGRFGHDEAVIIVMHHLPFIADQLAGLDQRFSDFQVIETISTEFKDQVKNFEMLRQMNTANGWKLSGSFYSIQDYNEANHGGCMKSSHERSMTETLSPSIALSSEENSSLETTETHERNLDRALTDPQDIGEKLESEAVSMTRTGDSEAKRPLRTLRGFEILDGREAMQPIEDSESDEFYITSEIWPFNVANSDQVVRCEMFGEITSWCITGYNEGYPFIWVSTKIADYLCDEPNEGYSPFFKALYEKAMLSILAFQILSNAAYMHFDEFLLKLVSDLMDRLGTFKEEEASQDYVNSQLGFVAKQLIGLDTIFFSKLPVIKTITDKFNVNIGEATNRKACRSFFSIHEKNKGREGTSNQAIHVEEKPRSSELKVQ